MLSGAQDDTDEMKQHREAFLKIVTEKKEKEKKGRGSRQREEVCDVTLQEARRDRAGSVH
eukprot:2679733-Rhodomonas_salina.2